MTFFFFFPPKEFILWREQIANSLPCIGTATLENLTKLEDVNNVCQVPTKIWMWFQALEVTPPLGKHTSKLQAGITKYQVHLSVTS